MWGVVLAVGGVILTLLNAFQGGKPAPTFRDQIETVRQTNQKRAKDDAELEETREKEKLKKRKQRAKGGKKSDKRKFFKGEAKLRKVLESLMYPHKFPSVKPVFLRNPKTGRLLELDCYCENLKLCVERDGEQHKKYNKFFHKNGPQDFYDQQERDLFKDAMLRARGIRMVRIPSSVEDEDIYQYLAQHIGKV